MMPDTDMPPPVINDDAEYDFWRFEDLAARKIISDRPDLLRKQTLMGFPRSLRTNQAQGAIALFRKADVKRWLLEHLEEFDPMAAAAKVKRPVGRPRKNPEQTAAAE